MYVYIAAKTCVVSGGFVKALVIGSGGRFGSDEGDFVLGEMKENERDGEEAE